MKRIMKEKISKIKDLLKNLSKKDRFKLVLLVITFILITVSGIIFKQSVLRITPLYISLFVMLLQTKANRYAFLLGGLNSILYSIVDISFGLYGQAAYAFLFSFTLQIATFLRWNKRKYGKTTVFREMTAIQRVCTLLAFAASWVVLYFVLDNAGSSHVILDNTSTLLGILQTVLCMLSFVEYTYLQLAGCVLNIIIYITLMVENTAQITYLIYSLFSSVCVIMAVKYIADVYKEQKKSVSFNT